METNNTITKIVKGSDTPGEREANQFATYVKAKNVWYCGTEQQYKEEQETTERLESNIKESGYETSILQSLNSTAKKDQSRSFVG